MSDTVEEEEYSNDSVDLISGSDSLGSLAGLKKCRVTVEPVIFLSIVALGTMMVTMQSYFINSICERENLKVNATIVDCSNLTANKEKETEVQLEAVKYLMYNTMIQTCLSFSYAIFLGDWIKRNGCKLTIILPVIGFVVAACYLIFLTHSGLAINTPLILLVSVPVGLTGGLLALVTSCYSYVSRITSMENRSFRLGILHAAATLGAPIGLLAASSMQAKFGFSGVFLLGLGLDCIALFYAIFFIPNDGPPSLSWSMFRGFLSLDAIKETAGLCIRQRDGSKRMWLLILYFGLALRVVTQAASDTVLYLFTRLKFGWSSVDYTDFITTDALLSVAGLVLVTMVGMKLLKLRDAPMGALGALSSMTGSILWIFAWAGWVPYLASVIQVFGGTVYLLLRSTISKIVSPEEVGTAFVLAGIMDTLIPLGASPLYGLVYADTLNIMPSAFFIISSACHLIIVLVFLFLSAVMPARQDETPILNSDEPSEPGHLG